MTPEIATYLSDHHARIVNLETAKERLEEKIDRIGDIVTKWTGAIDMVKWGLPLLIGLVALCCTMLGYALANKTSGHSALTHNQGTVSASSAPQHADIPTWR